MTQLDLNIHLRQIYLRQHLGCQKIHSKTSFKNTFSDCWEGKKRNKNTPPPPIAVDSSIYEGAQAKYPVGLRAYIHKLLRYGSSNISSLLLLLSG